MRKRKPQPGPLPGLWQYVLFNPQRCLIIAICWPSLTCHKRWLYRTLMLQLKKRLYVTCNGLWPNREISPRSRLIPNEPYWVWPWSHLSTCRNSQLNHPGHWIPLGWIQWSECEVVRRHNYSSGTCDSIGCNVGVNGLLVIAVGGGSTFNAQHLTHGHLHSHYVTL